MAYNKKYNEQKLSRFKKWRGRLARGLGAQILNVFFGLFFFFKVELDTRKRRELF